MLVNMRLEHSARRTCEFEGLLLSEALGAHMCGMCFDKGFMSMLEFSIGP